MRIFSETDSGVKLEQAAKSLRSTAGQSENDSTRRSKSMMCKPLEGAPGIMGWIDTSIRGVQTAESEDIFSRTPWVKNDAPMKRWLGIA